MKASQDIPRTTAATLDSKIELDAEMVAMFQNQNNDPAFSSNPDNKISIEIATDYPIATIKEYRRVSFQLDCERIFARIFGTQVSLLNYLSDRRDNAIPTSEVTNFYDEFINKSGVKTYSFDDWINFLSANQLIKEDPRNFWSLTNKGNDFIHYIKVNYGYDWNERIF